ncbi:MAG: GTPase domain-containing protein [Sandaracinaceae bacterium]|nr:GTPase domain-containing protein [Sandaracinaceae bacterium]
MAEPDEPLIRVVYWGVGLSGKTTNLQHLYAHTPPERRSAMRSMPTDDARILSFTLTASTPQWPTRLELCTVPGAVFFDVTRRELLARADAVVFVVDSQEARLAQAIEAARELAPWRAAHGERPVVFQYNKRDLPTALACESLDHALQRGDAPRIEAIATQGEGVFETLRTCVAHLRARRARR